MTGRSEWESFFDAHAPEYMENVFVKATEAEVDFMMEEFRLGAGSRIVDVGCGTGRHSVELARRGRRVRSLLGRGRKDEDGLPHTTAHSPRATIP